MKIKNYLFIFLFANILQTNLFSANTTAPQSQSGPTIIPQDNFPPNNLMQNMIRQLGPRFDDGYGNGNGYGRAFNPDKLYYKRNADGKFEEESFGEKTKRIALASAAEGYADAITKNIAEMFNTVPNMIKALFYAISVRASKIITGSLGLTSKSVVLFSNDINNKFNQLCFTKAIIQDRVKRSVDITTNADENAVDLNWKAAQKYLNMALDATYNYLISNIGSYDKNQEFLSSNIMGKSKKIKVWRKMLISLMHTFSIKNDQIIFSYIKQSLFDIENLKHYINSFKNYKDVENNSEYLKKWVNSLCSDLNSIAYELDGEMGKITIQLKTPAGGGIGGGNRGGFDRLADMGI